METAPEIISSITLFGKYGSVGIAVASIFSILVVVFLTYRFIADQSNLNRETIKEQSDLNRKSNKEVAEMMTKAIRELSDVVKVLAKENREDHMLLHNDNISIKASVDEMKYQFDIYNKTKKGK